MPNKYWKRDTYTADWCEKYDWAEQLKRDQNNVYLEYYKAYMGILDIDNWIYDSAYFVNSIYATIETIKPRLMSAVFGSWPYISLLPSRVLSRADYEKAKDEAMAVQASINASMDYPEFYITASDWITQACWWGHSPLKMSWRYDVTHRKFYYPRRDKKGGANGYDEKTEPVVLWDDLYYELVNQRNLFYPNEGKSMDDKDWTIERIDRNTQYIERQIEINKDNPMLGYNKKAGMELLAIMRNDSSYTDYAKEAQERLELKNLKYLPQQPYAAKTMLLDCRDKWTNEHCIIDYATGIDLTPMADHNDVYGESQYVAITPTSVPFETEGIGTIAPIYDTAGQINVLTNIGMDALLLNIAPPLLVDFRSKFEADYMIAQPGKVIQVYDASASMKYLQNQNLPVDHWKQIQYLQMQGQDVSGINDSAKGLENAGSQGGPAATYMAKQEAANMRIRLMKDIICNTGMAKIGEKAIRFNRIFRREDMYIPGADKYTRRKGDIIETRPEYYYRNYKFRTGSSSRADLSPTMRKQLWLELLAITSKLQPGQLEAEGERLKLTGIIKQICEADDIPKEELLETIGTKGSLDQANEMQNLLAGAAGGQPSGAGAPPNLGTMGQNIMQRNAQAVTR